MRNVAGPPLGISARCHSSETANALGASVEQAISGWCGRFAPHLLPCIDEIASPIRLKVEGRRCDLNADDAAALLGVSFEERQRLGLRTIGCCDLTPEEFREARKEAKRKRDRERLAEKRQAKRPRSQALMQVKPWETEGISRRTWYRRQKANGTETSLCAQGGETTMSPCAQSGGTEMSRIRNLSDRVTLLCHASIEPSLDDLQTAGGAPRAEMTEDSDDAV